MNALDLKHGKYPIDCTIKSEDGKNITLGIYMVVNAGGFFAEIKIFSGPNDGDIILIPLSPNLLLATEGKSINPDSVFLYQGVVGIPRETEKDFTL